MTSDLAVPPEIQPWERELLRSTAGEALYRALSDAAAEAAQPPATTPAVSPPGGTEET